MKRLIPTLILTTAAIAAAPAAGERNIGLLVEWIEVDATAANQLIHQFSDQENANALRGELENRIDAGSATLVETSYVVTSPGMRARVDSLLEHLYATEYDPPMLGSLPGFSPLKPGDVSRAALGVAAHPMAFDYRTLGTRLEIEPELGRDGRLEITIEASRSEYLADLVFRDTRAGINGAVQPLFRSLQTSTTFVSADGEDFLVDLLTPKNRSGQRIFLIARANVLRSNQVPEADLIGFGKLPQGATLTVDHRSDGCFHNTATRYEFTSDTVTISQLEPQLAKRGTVKLTGADRGRLDKTLAFYRRAPRGGCTTIEEVALTLRKDGKVVARESYVDGSCTIGEQQGLLPFGALDQRLAGGR